MAEPPTTRPAHAGATTRPAQAGEATVTELAKDDGRLLLVYRWPQPADPAAPAPL